MTTEFGIPLEKLDSGAYLSESGRYEIRPHGTRWKVWDHVGHYLTVEENGPPQVFRTVAAAAEAVAQQEAEI